MGPNYAGVIFHHQPSIHDFIKEIYLHPPESDSPMYLEIDFV